MNKMVCPHCMRPIGFSDLKRVCNVCGDSHPFTMGGYMMLKTGRVPHCKKPGCLGLYAVLKCAHCEKMLPNDLPQYDKYLRFSVVAPSAAGKSNFITTMMEELKNNSSLNFLINPMNRDTQRYHRECVDHIYDKLEPVPANEAGKVIPMQWCMKDLNRETRTSVPSYSLTVFDGAGEDQEKFDPVICRYIAGSKMIMLLLDPTKLAGVRAQMTPEEIHRAGGSAANVSREQTKDFLDNMIGYLKTACSVKARDKIETPVAVVFGKIDAVDRNLGSALVRSPSGHAAKGVFSLSEADNVHSEIEGWMDVCGDNLTKLFDANFKTWRYFGVSSYGKLPESRNKLNKPAPLRVLDPLIWNLALEGIVPIVK